MADVAQQILDALKELNANIVALRARRISGKDIQVVQGLSEISEKLGTIMAGEFRATDHPEIAPGEGFTGVRLTESGLRAYNNDKQTVGIENDGDFFLGSDLSDPGTTGFIVFSEAQTYNGESMGEGDILFGDNSDGIENILWDRSEQKFIFRIGTSERGLISVSGIQAVLDPAEITPAPIYWFDASLGITKNGSDQVSAWENQGSGQDLQQSTGALKPTYQDNQINGLPAVYFDGTELMETASDDSDMNSLDGMTVFIVYAPTDTSLSSRVVMAKVKASPSTDGAWWLNTAQSSVTSFNTFAVWNSASGVDTGRVSYERVSSGVFRVLTAVLDSKRAVHITNSNERMFITTGEEALIDEAQTGSDVAPASLPSISEKFVVGDWSVAPHNGDFIGKIAEFIIFNRTLDPRERDGVIYFLARKYALRD